MDADADHGPLLSTKTFTVHPTDTFETLMNHLFKLGAEMIPTTITNYADGKIIPEPQDDTNAVFTEKITKTDGYLDIKKLAPKEKIDKMIRAYYPWPGVWTQVKIKNKEVRIKFLPNAVIQMEGKKPQTVKDFLNGYPELKNTIEEILLL